MDNWNWTNDRFFDGTLARDTLFSLVNADPNESEYDKIKRQSQKFYDWLDVIRQEPHLTAIFGAHRDRAAEVLLRFFEHGTTAKRVRDQQNGNDPTRVPINLNLPLGDGGRQVSIVDGASALAYLFTIAKPPEGQAMTLQDYYLPMQILLCRCVYLAYVTAIDRNDGIYDFDSVPNMSCVMYSNIPGPDPAVTIPHYVFGTTFTSGSKVDMDDDAIIKSRIVMLDTHRRGQMNISLGLMNINEAPFGLSPHELTNCANFVWKTTVNHGVVRNAATAALTALQISFLALRQLQNVPPPVTDPTETCVPYNELWTKAFYKPQMLNLLKEAVRGIRQAAPLANNAAYLPFLMPFFRLWLYPHMLDTAVANNSWDNPQELGILEVVQRTAFETAADAQIAIFWQATSAIYVRQLAEYFEIIQLGKDSNTRRFGRCAESYPFAAMAFPFWNGGRLEHQPEIQGVAVDIRKVGKVDFSNAFHTTGFGNSVSLYRKPCELCTSALPKFRIDTNHYNGPVMDIPSANAVH